MKDNEQVLVDADELIKLVNTAEKLSKKLMEIKEVLKDQKYRVKKSTVEPSEVVEKCLQSAGVSNYVFYSRNRSRKVVRCRAIISYILRSYTELNLKKIAEYAGVGNHATVLSHLRKIERDIRLDPETNALTRETFGLLNIKLDL